MLQPDCLITVEISVPVSFTEVRYTVKEGSNGAASHHLRWSPNDRIRYLRHRH